MAVKIRSRIFLRVFILFASLVLIIMLFFAYMIIPMQKNALQRIMYTQGVTVSRSIIQASSDAVITNDFGFIVEHNVEVLKNNPGIHFVAVAPNRGNTIWVDQSGWKILHSPLLDLTQLQTEKIEYRIKHEGSQTQGYHFVYPIEFSGIKWGWLHIEFSTHEYNAHIEEMYLKLIYIAAIAMSLIIFVGFFFARWVTRPISTISNLATQVANGNLTVRSTINRKDEIGALSTSFNKMVKSLQYSKKKLENYNQLLEQEVKKRTLDLNSLNKNLDKKVKEQVVQRQEQEQLLIHQSRLAAMGEMIGAIAHQWRQPLNALNLVLQNQNINYHLGKLDEETMTQSMEKSDRLINKMSTTIDDFRNFFKPNKHAEFFNINTVIESTIGLVDAQFKNHNIEININCEKELNINGFQGEFSQVILNLLNNAKDILIERHKTDPIIKINAHTGPNGINITIHDNAGGIPADIINKIYDPYFTTKDEGKGTGIGLYMSKMIVENNMQGKLYAFNDLEDSNFVIEIPTKKLI